MKLEESHQYHGIDHKVNLIKLLIEKYLIIEALQCETNNELLILNAKRQYYKK